MAKKIACGPTLAFLATRRVVDAAHVLSFTEQLEAERAAQQALGDTPDFLEAMKAFTSGKKPHFKGRL